MAEYWGKSFGVAKTTYESRTVDGLSGNTFNKPPMPALVKLAPYFFPAPNPQMRPFIAFLKRTWDSFSSGPVLTTCTGKTFVFEASPWTVFTGETLSGYEYTSKRFPFKTVLFGNVLTGYLKLPSGTLITDGFRVIFKNSYGFSIWGKCYPTGLYQLVLDPQRYDKSYLLVEGTTIEIYYQYGAFYVDGFLNQLPKDLFFLPDQDRGAHVIGFKKKRVFA